MQEPLSDHVGARSVSLRQTKSGGPVAFAGRSAAVNGGGGAAASASSVASLGHSMSSANDSTIPSVHGMTDLGVGSGVNSAAPVMAVAVAASAAAAPPKKSNWEVIEHYHKSGLHGTSSTTRHQQLVRPISASYQLSTMLTIMYRTSWVT